MDEAGRKHLEDVMRKEVTKLFESVLDYTSIAVSEKDRFSVLRGKILRVGNDCIRTIASELSNYEIELVERTEDVIEFKNR
jgi:hypothetical protein